MNLDGEGAEQAKAEPEPEEQSSALDFEAILDRPPCASRRRYMRKTNVCNFP